jgi:hypothetical protein
MDLLCQEFKDYYHEERPHQGLENELVIKGSRTKKLSKSGAKRSEIVSIAISEIRYKEARWTAQELQPQSGLTQDVIQLASWVHFRSQRTNARNANVLPH